MSEVIEQMKKQGFDVKGQKVLAATPRTVSNYYALGKRFMLTRDEKGNVLKHGWTAVTKDEAVKLAGCTDPTTGAPYLRFAYVPIPAEMLKTKTDRVVDSIDVSDLNQLPGGAEEYEPSNEHARAPGGARRVDDEFDRIQKQREAELAAKHGERESPEPTDYDAGEASGPLEKSEQVEAEPAKTDTVTSADIERKELKEKSFNELKQMVKDLGMEVPKKATKDELIEMIVG